MVGRTNYLIAIFFAIAGTALGQECFSPFQEFQGLCFLVVEEKSTFDEARSYCSQIAGDGFGGDLISTSTCDDFTIMGRYLEFYGNKDEKYWVGARTAFSANEWFWLNLEPLSTGVPFFGENEGTESGEDCAAMDGSQYWRLADMKCDTAMPFICAIAEGSQKKVEPVVRDDPVLPEECPRGSIDIGDYCYVFSSSERYWSAAEENCREDYKLNNGALFYPESCEEFSQLAHHIEADENTRRDWWVGARDVTGDHTWNWVDGTTVPGGLPFWASGFPDHGGLAAPNTQCGFMSNNKRFYLEDGLCNFNRRYVCKLHKVINTD